MFELINNMPASSINLSFSNVFLKNQFFYPNKPCAFVSHLKYVAFISRICR